MADPIGWRIQQDLYTALGNISIANGYFTDATVSYVDNYEQNLQDNEIILGTTNPVESVAPAEGQYRWRQRFSMIAFASENADVVDERLWKLRADIEKAVMQDPHRSNLAIDTIVQAPEWIVEADGRAGIECFCDVDYRTDIDDPTANTQ